MSQTAEKVKHAYIVSRKGYCGGRPIIVGTKFPVSSIVNYILKQGMTPEELVKEFPHLSLSQIYDALSYYYDHKEEMDKDIESSSEISLSKELGGENG
ncbi:MAG: DUF433 domain-containing protein [Candidatus Scalindua sp.]